jgi:hypothetical protein
VFDQQPDLQLEVLFKTKSPIIGMAAIAAVAFLSQTSTAFACSKSVIEPGSDTTDPVHVMKRGTSCSATFNFSQDRINSIRVVGGPKNGSVSVRGNNSYSFKAGTRPGPDEFTVEFDTTRYDWLTGNPTWRKTWRVKQPFIIE